MTYRFISVSLLRCLQPLYIIYFLLSAFIQYGYAVFFSRYLFSLPVTASPVAEADRQPVSIIICAKNEAVNLRKNLPAILEQEYHNAAGLPLYEVIVVNDASTDATENVLNEMELRYDHLWDVIIPLGVTRKLKGKKFALSNGVAYATHNWLLLTDADCVPASRHWLSSW